MSGSGNGIRGEDSGYSSTSTSSPHSPSFSSSCELVTKDRSEINFVQETDETHSMKKLKIPLPPSVVRRFLDDGRGSLTELRDVNSLFEVAERAAVIVDACKVHPVQAFHFCSDTPNGGVEEFLELKRLSFKAFRLEGHRVMHMLEEEDRQMLMKTQLAYVVKEFRSRDSQAMILSELQNHKSKNLAVQILNSDACVYRISIGGEEKALARELLEFWDEKNEDEKRRNRLEVAFSERDMILRSHCEICNAYISGWVHAGVDDIVGLSVIASRLKGRQRDFDKYFPACEMKFKHHYHVKKQSLEDAVRQAMTCVRKIDKNILLNQDEISSAFVKILHHRIVNDLCTIVHR